MSIVFPTKTYERVQNLKWWDYKTEVPDIFFDYYQFLTKEMSSASVQYDSKKGGGEGRGMRHLINNFLIISTAFLCEF